MFFIQILFLLGLSLNSHAKITFEDAIFPELATSGRALAMGNAFIAKVDDASAAFYNPAGLGTVRFGHFHLSNLHAEFNKGWFDLATKGRVNKFTNNISNGFSIDGYRKLLEKKPGYIMSSRLHAIPNLTTRYFSLGYLASRRIKGALGKKEDDLFQYAYRWDHGPYVAINISLFGGVIKVGGSVIWLNRKEVFGETDPSIQIKKSDLTYKEGSLNYTIGGAKLTLPIAWLPTFAGTLHNSSQKDFIAKGNKKAPDEIKKTIVAGFSLTPQIGKRVRTHIEVNYKDLDVEFKDVKTSRRWTGGLEFDIARRFFVRFGYGDGFGSAGFGIKSRKLEFDLTTYAVDITSNDWRGKEDRRTVFNISAGI